ncbi:hypothetical protein TrLO_g9709 [Triparma laevis f. longispina]|uniref:Uncharacterized protein n=1 Tax=Triparma laevis f. longispina TaxID=1714387 RepID=A0A9W6ZV92_9STRA|nr:hypothetical protein TrLO_g9709 [Triparma laevis f. longispina]
MSRDASKTSPESLNEPLLDLSTIRTRIEEEKSKLPSARAVPVVAAPLTQPSAPPSIDANHEQVNTYGVNQPTDYDILKTPKVTVSTPANAVIATGVPLHTVEMGDFPDKPPMKEGLLDFRGKGKNYRPLEMSSSDRNSLNESDSLLLFNPHSRQTGAHQSRASSSNPSDLRIADQNALQREREESFLHQQGQFNSDAKNRQEKMKARTAGRLAQGRDHDGDNVVDRDEEKVRRQIVINEQERRMEELGLKSGKDEEKDDDKEQYGGSGGYQCSEYKSEYESSNYDTSEYKSIYD